MNRKKKNKSVFYPLPDSRYLPPRYLQKTCQSALLLLLLLLLLGLSQQASLASSSVFLFHSFISLYISFLERRNQQRPAS